MILRYALLCDSSNETSDHRLNIFGVMEAVFAYQFPAIHREMHLICCFELEPDDGGMRRKIEVRFIDADANPLFRMEAVVDCPHGRRVLNHRHIFHDTQLPEPGLFQFDIAIDEVQVASVPLEVIAIARQSS